MARIVMRLKHVHCVTKNGRSYYYYGRGKGAPRLPDPSSPRFEAAYYKAAGKRPAASQGGKTSGGSLSAAIDSWQKSAQFKQYALGTRTTYGGIADRWKSRDGKAPIAGLRSHHIVKMMNDLADKPGAAVNLKKVVSAVLKHAKATRMILINPMVEARQDIKITRRTKGHHRWTDHEVKQFQDHYPLGTRARLAIELFICTGLRKVDMVRTGPQHVRDGAIDMPDQKTGQDLWIPVHPDLQAAIDAHPSGQLAFVVTRTGRPFTAAGFGNYFAELCRDAGLPENCRAHGLRKATCCRLAEMGCTAPEISSITRQTLKTVEMYIREVNRKALARNAMGKLVALRKNAT